MGRKAFRRTRDDLDAVAKDHPMYFERIDGHVAVANTRALQIARITAKTSDPPGGQHHARPQNRRAEWDAGRRRRNESCVPANPGGFARKMAARGGVGAGRPGAARGNQRAGLIRRLTASKDPNALPETITIYQQLKKEGKLTARIFEWLSFDLPLARLEKFRQEIGTDDPWLKTGGLKAFMDGSLGSRTAAMYAPYSDDPATKGILRVDPAKLKQQAIERDRAGFQILFHAIGDRGNGVALDTFAAATAANGARDRRDRVEHAQVVAPDDFARFATLNVIAST